MGRFRNVVTGVVVAVDDVKDSRFTVGWDRVDVEPERPKSRRKSHKAESDESEQQ